MLYPCRISIRTFCTSAKLSILRVYYRKGNTRKSCYKNNYIRSLWYFKTPQLQVLYKSFTVYYYYHYYHYSLLFPKIFIKIGNNSIEWTFIWQNTLHDNGTHNKLMKLLYKAFSVAKINIYIHTYIYIFNSVNAGW